MKPKPLSWLKNLTVPVAIIVLLKEAAFVPPADLSGRAAALQPWSQTIGRQKCSADQRDTTPKVVIAAWQSRYLDDCAGRQSARIFSTESTGQRLWRRSPTH
jgi:hypothetical protein